MTPVTKGWDEIFGPLGIDTSDIPDTNPAQDMQTGSEWFDNQDEATQRQILGNAKYDAWNNGDFTLDDIVGTNDDPDWGKSISFLKDNAIYVIPALSGVLAILTLIFQPEGLGTFTAPIGRWLKGERFHVDLSGGSGAEGVDARP